MYVPFLGRYTFLGLLAPVEVSFYVSISNYVIDTVLSKLSSFDKEHLFRLPAVQIPPPICL